MASTSPSTSRTFLDISIISLKLVSILFFGPTPGGPIKSLPFVSCQQFCEKKVYLSGVLVRCTCLVLVDIVDIFVLLILLMIFADENVLAFANIFRGTRAYKRSLCDNGLLCVSLGFYRFLGTNTAHTDCFSALQTFPHTTSRRTFCKRSIV